MAKITTFSSVKEMAADLFGLDSDAVRTLIHWDEMEDLKRGTVIYQPSRNRLGLVIEIYGPTSKYPKHCMPAEQHSVYCVMVSCDTEDTGFDTRVLVDPYDWEIIGKL